MGRLVGLELHNFKSYRGTASIGFGSGNFISIIGPNGSGKSNMMDAISFVLGIRSSHLRSSKLKDLIYRGRIDDEKYPADSSDLEDQLAIEDDEDDPNNPRTAYVEAIYERGKDDSVRFRRTITVQGTSEYKINEELVSASEYSNVLKKEGILIKARNFLVFQGDVEQIASQSPQDLTKLMETISGSIEFRKEYESLLEDLEKAREDTNSLFQRKKILNGEMRQYKEQKSESDHFEKKMSEKINLIKNYRLWQLYNIEKSKNSLIDNLEERNNELDACKNKIKKDGAKLKKMNAAYANGNLNIISHKASVDKLNLRLKGLNKNLVPLTTKRDVAIKKIADLERKSEEIKYDIQTQNANIEELKKQKAIVEKSMKIFERQHFSKKQEFDLPTDGQQQYEILRQEFLSNGGAILEGELNMLNNDKESLVSKIENLEKQKNNYLGRSSSLQENLASFNSQLLDARIKLQETIEEISFKKNYLNEARMKKELLLSEEFELNTQIKDILIKLDELNASQRETNRERKLRENVSNLQRLFPGVKGLVCDLCKPKQKKYEIAVATILGKSFDSIIVDNMTVAQRCINYLKEQRAGVASFIPLDSVDSQPPSSNLRHLHQSAKPILDIIEYDPALERAMQYACGNSIVCDDMGTAKYIRWQRKIDTKVVTLDGSLIHKAGLMTGGVGKKQNGISRSSTWDKSELVELSRKKDELLNKLEMIQQEKPNEIVEKQVLNDISELENDIPLLQSTVNEMERNVKDAKAEIEYQHDLLNKVEEDLAFKQNSLIEVISSSKACENRVHSLQTEIYSTFSEDYDIDIDEYEQAHGQSMLQQEQERAKFIKQISSLDNKIEFENDRLQQSEGRLVKINNEHKRHINELETIKEERNKLQEDIELLESEIEIATEKSQKMEASLKADLVAIKEKEESVADERLNFEMIFKKCSTIEQDIEAEISKKLSALRSSKIENVSIPLLEGSLDDIPIGEAPENLLDISESIIIDYNKLPKKYHAISDLKVLDKDFNDKIKKITEELESLSPNTKATERLQEVETRLKEVDQNHLKTREHESSLSDRFDEVKEKRYNLFMEAFDFISTKIDSTYKDLTKAEASPLGGSAYLTLEDEEEPYNSGIKYHAMPPLKRFRDMELLSGGEKTVAALALLFAIHSFQPSPFFVLDEVDAALDNANIQRVANYIVKHSGPNFQFIVISLKNGLFEKSDALVGIYREQVKNSSKTLSIDLREYPR